MTTTYDPGDVFVRGDRIIYAAEYHLAGGSTLIVWFNREGRDKNGRTCHADSKRAIVTALAERGFAVPKVQYRLYDWTISRQRYWGPPIPMLYCDACGTVPVPEDQLPVLLPPLEDFRPDDSGISPLVRRSIAIHTAGPSHTVSLTMKCSR